MGVIEDSAGCPNLDVMESAARVPDDKDEDRDPVQPAVVFSLLLPIVISVESHTSFNLMQIAGVVLREDKGIQKLHFTSEL